MAAAVASATAYATAAAFGGYGTHAGQFIEPFGLAVDRASGDLYVLDTNNNRVEKFTASGRFLLAWGWGVADGHTPALQTCARVCFGGLRGKGPGEFDFAEGIAIEQDPASPFYGDVYIADILNHRVQAFTPNGRFLMMFGRGVNPSARHRHETGDEDVCPVHAGDVCGTGVGTASGGALEYPVEGHFIVAGATGTIYVGERDRVQEFSPAGEYQGEVELPRSNAPLEGEAGGVSGLQVDAAGDLYVIRVGVKGVDEFDPSGRPLRTFDERETAENSEGPVPVVALGPAGDVFVDYFAGGEHRIDEFDPTGAELESFDRGMPDGLHGIAYSESLRALYVFDTGPNLAGVRVVPVPDTPRFQPTGGLALWLIPRI